MKTQNGDDERREDRTLRPESSFVGDLTWDAVRRRLDAGALAILPIGAGAKQHGWHLPMRTDAIQAEWLATQLAQAFPALIWPVVSYGYYPAFVSYAGSCSLSAELFQAMVRELVISLLGYGASAVLVLDTGISTIAPIDQAIEGLNALHLKVHAGPHYRDAAGRLSTQLHGSHADELETSRLLALAPHLVDMGRAAASPAEPPGAGPMQHVNPSEANYSASGSIGDPAAATADKGWVLLDAMVKDMTDTVRTWRAVSAR
jgi:creatinine amidohydrolase